jgi:peptide chain release factor subunit 1
MDLRTQLTRLGRIVNAPSPVVSVYLNTRWSDEHQRERVRVFVRNEIEKARRAHGDTALDSDLAWIEAEVGELISQARYADARGIALFACGALGLREVLPVRVPFDDAFVVSDAAFLLPLAGALETAPPAVIAFVDSESARLIPVGPEGTGEEVALKSHVPGHHRRGGWANLAMSRYQRHIQDHRERHYEAVADALQHVVESHGIERIVLAGEARNVSLFRQHLPDRVTSRVAGSIPGSRQEPAAVLIARASELLAGVEDREAVEAVDRLLTEAAKGGRAVVGVTAVLEAVSWRAARRLYLLKRFSERGRECTQCGTLQTGPDGACGVCHGATKTVDLESAMVDRVVAAGGTVTTLDRHDELARLGGVAAGLRYPL